MTEMLTPAQRDWLTAHVDRGEFTSLEAAARALIDEGIALRAELAGDDLAWAKPFVDEALAEVDRGMALTRAEYRARVSASRLPKD